MNGQSKEHLEMEGNVDPERLSLSEPHKTVPGRTVSKSKYCCFRFRFWSVHPADQTDGGQNEREIKVSCQNRKNL